jgi:hypothetical protein
VTVAWQLTTVLARTARAIGLRRRWGGAAALTRATALAEREERPGRDTVFARVAVRARRRLPEAERFALAKAVVDLDADARAVIERALASGAPAPAILALAHQWSSLRPTERAVATSPLPRGDEDLVLLDGVPATQVDPTTCGAASMAIMLMMGDPFVGLWVASGKRLGGYTPPEVRGIPVQARLDTVERRWGALQKAIHRETVRRGLLLLLPWPRRLGTPPWRVNNATRFAGLAFRGAVVDDTDDADVTALISHASAALRDGIPVPIYASGDSAKGIDTVIPRHVVLLVRRHATGFVAYEPGSARLYAITDDQILDGGAGLRALGNWSHVAWMILPRARTRP